MKRLMQILGFDGDEYDDEEEYVEEPPRPSRKPSGQGKRPKEQRFSDAPRLVLFRGVPSEKIKLRLRDALLDGVMILLDLHDLDSRQFEEVGQPFINFMGGVAFAHKGCMEFIEPAHYLVTPGEGMFEEWAEEETVK